MRECDKTVVLISTKYKLEIWLLWTDCLTSLSYLTAVSAFSDTDRAAQ